MRTLSAGLLGVALACGLALTAHAECYVDFKAKRDNPLKLAYGVAQVSDAVCGNRKAEHGELAPRLQAAGWTLLKIVSNFGAEGLEQRKPSAGDFYLRY